ncbi:MAG: hypothetical protein KatS3mg009_2851 [Acidimicrobiia bacterium]|nr:MAG: hypothetical protein KatS3mg009_2851 [Acidimicrobiia bacterium]
MSVATRRAGEPVIERGPWSVAVRSGPGDAEWDAFVGEVPGGHYAQLSAWARLRGTSGWRARRIVVSRRGEVVGGAQLLLRPLPVVGSLGYVPRGPLLAAGPGAPPPDLVVDALERVARGERVRHLAVQPPLGADELAGLLPVRGFRANPRIGGYTATVRIDLRRDPGELLARMRKSTRANVRRALDRGIEVREGDGADVDALYGILREASRRKGFSIPTLEYHRELWRHFAADGRAHVFVAEAGGVPVTAHLVLVAGGCAYAHVAAWDGSHRHLMPNEAVEWHVIRWAKARGCASYDLEGVDPASAGPAAAPGAPRAGDRFVSDYKLGWEREVTAVPPTYEFVPGRVARWGYEHVYPWLESNRLVKRLRAAAVPSVHGAGADPVQAAP